MKNFPVFFFILISGLTSSYSLSQNMHTMNEKRTVELETVQTPSGAFISAAMIKGPGNTMPYVIVYRSPDNGISWDSITSIVNADSSLIITIADPVLALDSSGVINLVLMYGYRVNLPNANLECHLHLYQSYDDGLTWNFKNKPFSGEGLADYPQLISSGSGKLDLTFMLFKDMGDSIAYVASEDNGNTWTVPVFFAEPLKDTLSYSIGSDIGIDGTNTLCFAFGGGYHDSIYFSKSFNDGNTWQPVISVPLPIRAPVNKIICRNGSNSVGIISHKPHVLDSPVYFSVSNDSGISWQSQLLCETGSYGEGYLDKKGVFHVIYNEHYNGHFRLMYTYSTDSGATFRTPAVLYSGLNTVSWATGEYQSLIMAKDSLFHLIFVDNSDYARAKQIIFSSQLTAIASHHEKDTPKVFPNPVKDLINVEISPESGFREFEIDGLNGMIIQSGYLNSSLTQIKIADEGKGIMLLKLISPTRIFITKIIR